MAVLFTCSQSFQVFYRGSVTFKMEMQIQVQIRDTRQVFFMNPPRSLNELTTAISHEIPKTCFIDFGLLYLKCI